MPAIQQQRREWSRLNGRARSCVHLFVTVDHDPSLGWRCQVSVLLEVLP
jgi:hypothetical protein